MDADSNLVQGGKLVTAVTFPIYTVLWNADLCIRLSPIDSPQALFDHSIAKQHQIRQ